MAVLEDTDLIIMGALAFASTFFYAMGERNDNVFFLLPSGIVAFLLAFEIWTLTANISATIAVVALAITIMSMAVVRLFQKS